ncbi:MAG: exonuclease SbcCD subunit D [Pyrobaculum sp.]
MKILHISDAHLGRAQYHLSEREEDYYLSFTEALKRGAGADVVLVTGDLFDTKRPPTRALVKFVEAVEGVGAPIYLIGGNHDFSYVRFRNCGRECLYDTALRLLERVGLARLLCWEGADVGGVYIYGACATPREYVVEYRERLRTAPPGSVLAIHQGVVGAASNYPGEEDDYTMPPEVFNGLSYIHIAAGHIHDHFVKHPVGALWAGSVDVWDVREFETWEYVGRWELVKESASKGVVLIDVAGRGVSYRSIPLPRRRPMYRLRLYVREGVELIGAVEEAARRFDKTGALVRIELVGAVERGVRPRQLAMYFSKALYIDVVDRTVSAAKAVAFRGSAFDQLWQVLKERLGEHAEVVQRAMALVRDGEREAAYRLILKALYD